MLPEEFCTAINVKNPAPALIRAKLGGEPPSVKTKAMSVEDVPVMRVTFGAGVVSMSFDAAQFEAPLFI